MVTSSSTLAQVFAASIVSPTENDLSSWTEITPLAAAPTISTKVGLFGGDLTDFYFNCAVASAVCAAADFHKFTGWAIAAQWTWATAATTGDKTGICFEADNNCVTIKAGATDNLIQAFTSVDVPAAAEPNIADGGYCTISNHGGFNHFCWYGKLEPIVNQVQIAYRFQNTNDPVREVGDVEKVWVTPGIGGTANLATTVTYANAAYLTSAAGIIVLSLLF